MCVCANFQAEQTALTFTAQICPKMDFRVKILKIELWIWNQYPGDTMCINFQTKRATLNFWAQICPKIDLGVET